MNIKNIKGLKYPDEYFIKFFFKNNLHKRENKKYLDIGCSNGCNSILPYQFNNSIVGVDLDATLIQYANENFSSLEQQTPYFFYVQDMRDFCKEKKEIFADILILANSIYYIPKNDFISLLQNIKKHSLIKEKIPFFIRFREVDDFRNQKGKIVGENAIIMQNGITGEDDIFCQFYKTEEMIEILKDKLDLKNFEIMHIRYDNIQNNTIVNNSDVVIWGTIN
jgi:SAM-dependent methyltransferase